jgi:hypothetical protein
MQTDYRSELLPWLIQFGGTEFFTFNFGYDVGVIDGNRQIKHFYNVMQRRVNGRDWHHCQPEERIQSIGFWEHTEKWSNPHCHMLVRGPKQLLRLTRLDGEPQWQKQVPRGQLCAEKCETPDQVASYISKRCITRLGQDKMFVYT